jgi:hypothetical protein
MQPKYQIFISSTYEDLRPQRDHVLKAVLEMGHIPVGMEMFSAADEEQWQIIARHIEESDYYVVLIAHRYGSADGTGLSFTRKEYEYALRIGVPALGFILDPTASWPADMVDTGEDAKRLEDFKTLVLQKPVGFWNSADDLHAKTSIALMKAFTATPRPGWIPASAGIAPGMTQELSRLSAENSILRLELEQSRQESSTERRSEEAKIARILSSNERVYSYRDVPRSEWQLSEPIQLGQVFAWLAPSMVVEISAVDASGRLAMHCRTDRESKWDIVAMNQVDLVFSDLVALDLVEPSPSRHSVHDNNKYWVLSEQGRAFLKALNRQILEGTSDLQAEEIQPEVEPELSNATKKTPPVKKRSSRSSATKSPGGSAKKKR